MYEKYFDKHWLLLITLNVQAKHISPPESRDNLSPIQLKSDHNSRSSMILLR